MRAISTPVRTPVRALRPRRLLVLSSDDTLVDQMRRGNEAAFEVVFERHGPGILGFCRHMLGRPDEAEDAVQHIFASAFRALQQDDRRELALKPWLYTIARNRCRSMLRSRREQVALDDEPATVGLAEQVERRAELRELLQDLRDLPEEQRAALLLAEAGGLSHTDVADVLGCEVARVKALVFRARSGLIRRREARDTPCSEIREQLANLSGGSLRRSELRHHLHVCPGCRDYREQVKSQRRMLAAALPVAPSLALKSSVLAAIGLGGGSAGGGGLATGLAGLGGGVSAALGGGGVAKLAAVSVLAGGAVVGGNAVLDNSGAPARAPSTADTRPAPGTKSPPASMAMPWSDPPGGPREPGAALRVERSPSVQHSPRQGTAPGQRAARVTRPRKTRVDRGRRVGHQEKLKASAPRAGGPPPGRAKGRQGRETNQAGAKPGTGSAKAAAPKIKPVTGRPPQPKAKKPHRAAQSKKATPVEARPSPPREPVAEARPQQRPSSR
jgi:RNA polymerase sigma factor (sigma-70 family)